MSDMEFTLGEASRSKLCVGDTLEINVLTEEGGIVLRRYEIRKLRKLSDGVKVYAEKIEEGDQ